MRVLVTGAGGFIGKHIAEFLWKQGMDVLGTVHRPQETIFPNVVCELSNPLNLEDNFDVIIHAAGKTPTRKGLKREYERQLFCEFKKANVDSMENVINFAREKHVPRIIYLSTIGIYGQIKDTVVSEDTDKVNLDVYGMTKYMGEMLLHDVEDIQHISLRMPGVIDVDSSNIWFTNTVDKFRENEDVTIYSPDFKTRNFVWLPDLCSFIERLIYAEKWKYDVVNVACNELVSVREIVDEMKRRTGSNSQIIVEEGMQKPFCLDNKRVLEMGYASIGPLEMVKEYCK